MAQDRVDWRTDYEPVAASQSDQVLGGPGKQGDILQRLVITVNTAATAQVQIRDGSGGSLITIMPNSPGGGIGVYVVELGMRAATVANGGWRVTTGAGSTVVAVGRFT